MGCSKSRNRDIVYGPIIISLKYVSVFVKTVTY